MQFKEKPQQQYCNILLVVI